LIGIAGGLIAALAMVAHPIGFLWLLGTLAYVRVSREHAGWWKVGMPLAAASGLRALLVRAHRPALMADWDRGPFYLLNGAEITLALRNAVRLAGGARAFPRACLRWGRPVFAEKDNHCGGNSNCRSNCTL